MAAATLVSDGRGRLPSDYLFDDVDPGEVEALLEEPYPKDVPYQCLLVRTDATVVLVDAGLGPVQHPLGGTGGGLASELVRPGVSPEKVDLVVVTHGHLDHVGGNARDGAPAFPRARYVMSRTDWEFWTSEEVLATSPPPAPTWRGGTSRRSPPPACSTSSTARRRSLPGSGWCRLPGTRRPAGSGGRRRASLSRGCAPPPRPGVAAGVGHGLDEDPETAAATLRALLSRAAANGLPVACAHVEGVFGIEPKAGAFELTKV